MSRLKDLVREDPIHQRVLQIQSYPVEPDRLLVEGWLKDDRQVAGFHWNGTPREPGVVHWIGVRLLVGGWPLAILDAEAEMPQVPHERCADILAAVRRVVGLSIVSGFSAEIRRRLGGDRGCAHMTQLILTMGPAALHGYWTQRSLTRRPVPRSLEELPGLQATVNSCHLWGPDGPIMREVRETIEREAAK